MIHHDRQQKYFKVKPPCKLCNDKHGLLVHKYKENYNIASQFGQKQLYSVTGSIVLFLSIHVYPGLHEETTFLRGY